MGLTETYIESVKSLPDEWLVENQEGSTIGGLLHEFIFIRPSYWRDSTHFAKFSHFPRPLILSILMTWRKKTASRLDQSIICEILESITGGVSCEALIQAYRQLQIGLSPPTKPEKPLEPPVAFINHKKMTKTQANKKQPKDQSLIDHLIWFTISSTGTVDQKIRALFLNLVKLDPRTFSTNNANSNFPYSALVSILSTKDLLHRMMEFLGLPIPFSQLSDSFESAIYGRSSQLVSARVLIKRQGGKELVIDVTPFIQELSAVSHAVSGTKNLFISSKIISHFLFEYYNGMQSFSGSESVKISVETQKFGEKKTKNQVFLIDVGIFEETLSHFQGSTKSGESNKAISHKKIDLGIMRDFSEPNKALGDNDELEFLLLEDVHATISFAQFKAGLMANPFLNWVLGASPERSLTPGAQKLGFEYFEKLINLKGVLRSDKSCIFKATLKSSPGDLLLSLRRYSLGESERLFIKQELKKQNGVSPVHPNTPEELRNPLFVNIAQPLSDILEEIEMRSAIQALRSKRASPFFLKILEERTKNKKHKPPILSSLTLQSNSGSVDINESMSLLQILSHNPKILNSEEINLIQTFN